MRPETIRRLLSVMLSFKEPCTDEQFARAAYGDSKSWKQSRKVIASAAGVAGRLKAMGLVGRTSDLRGRWFVTEAGMKYLVRAATPASPPVQPQSKLDPQPVFGFPVWVRCASAPGGLLWFDGRALWWRDAYGRWRPWVAAAS